MLQCAGNNPPQGLLGTGALQGGSKQHTRGEKRNRRTQREGAQALAELKHDAKHASLYALMSAAPFWSRLLSLLLLTFLKGSLGTAPLGSIHQGDSTIDSAYPFPAPPPPWLNWTPDYSVSDIPLIQAEPG